MCKEPRRRLRSELPYRDREATRKVVSDDAPGSFNREGVNKNDVPA